MTAEKESVLAAVASITKTPLDTSSNATLVPLPEICSAPSKSLPALTTQTLSNNLCCLLNPKVRCTSCGWAACIPCRMSYLDKELWTTDVHREVAPDCYKMEFDWV